MSFMIRATLAGSLIGAAMTASAALAAADQVPRLNVEPSCQSAAQQAASADYVTVCRNSEQRAHDQMQQQWSQLNAADKAQCVPASTAGGTPSYTELLTCLELARDVRQLHGKPEPTTAGQAVK
jgi:hypothetical protein